MAQPRRHGPERVDALLNFLRGWMELEERAFKFLREVNAKAAMKLVEEAVI